MGPRLYQTSTSLLHSKKGNICPLSRNVREPQRNQLCPKLIQTNEEEIGKFRYAYEVH